MKQAALYLPPEKIFSTQTLIEVVDRFHMHWSCKRGNSSEAFSVAKAIYKTRIYSINRQWKNIAHITKWESRATTFGAELVSE